MNNIKPYLKTMGVSAIVSIISLFVFYNFIPVGGVNSLTGNGLFGSTVTTIQGTDTLKNSRTTINDNFASLNATKVENSTTTFPSLITLPGLTTATNLAVVGTITTGIWHGSVLDVTYGGTGSSSLASKQILFGNGTSPLQNIGFGNAGEFLTSSGTNALPFWSTASFNLNSNYSVTGLWNFTTTTATTTFSGNVSMGGATINGLRIATGTSAGNIVVANASSSLPIIGGENLTRMASNTSAFQVISSATLKQSADTSRATNSLSYVKVKEIKYNDVAGTISVSYAYARGGAGNDAVYFTVYKNGSAVGTEKSSVTGSPVAFAQDFSVVSGDLLQLYEHVANSADTAIVTNFRLLYTKSLIESSPTVNLD